MRYAVAITDAILQTSCWIIASIDDCDKGAYVSIMFRRHQNLMKY